MPRTLMLLAASVFLWSFALGQAFKVDLPSDENALQQKLKEIAEMPVPDDPVVFQDEIEVARQNSDNIKNSVIPALHEERARWPSSLNNYQIQLSSLTNQARDCSNPALIQSSLRGLSFAFYGVDLSGLNTEIQRLAALPDKTLCQELSKPTERDKLSSLGNGILDTAMKQIETQLPIAQKIGDAWNKRYQRLVIAQRQISDTRRSMLWIVLAVCGFSCIILFGVKLFDEKSQMELIVSGQMIQFPTVMILLIVVVVLGLTGTVKENTLAALLGGIAGYVLSQGVGRQALRQGQMSRSRTPSPDDASADNTDENGDNSDKNTDTDKNAGTTDKNMKDATDNSSKDKP